MKIRVGILGATGYTGYEVFKLLAKRSDVDLLWLSSENSPNKKYSEIYPVLGEQILVSTEQALSGNHGKVDYCFVCLPHTLAMQNVPKLLAQGIRVIDLSADFRIKNPSDYERWYQEKHTASNLLAEAVYGLSELYRSEIQTANLVANPGCYPTSILLPTIPLLKRNLITTQLIADSKSSISGAGRATKTANLFCEVNENFYSYSVGKKHRHLAEIGEQLKLFAGNEVELIFSPHVIPINRGILSTIYLQLKSDVTIQSLHECLLEQYAGEKFVKVLPLGETPSIRHVAHSNNCLIGLVPVDENRAIIVSVIDNLLKGAAGQAVQNFNIMAGISEEEGLI